ncbi:MAG: PAS domain S-box protein [Dongiaceae bacterium]
MNIGDEALRSSEARYRQIVEISLEAIFIHCGGRVVFANQQAALLFGFDRPEAMVGQPTFDLIHPDDRARAQERTRILLEEGSRVPMTEMRYLGRDGAPVVLQVQAVPIPYDGRPAVLVVGRDVTDRVRADQALRESEGRFTALADILPALLWMSGPDGGCSFVNRPWADYTGRPAERELGRGYLDNVHPEHRAQLRRHEATMLGEHRAVANEYRLRGRDGRYRWFLDTSVPRFAPDGAYLGHIGLLIDVDGQRRLEARLHTILESTVDGLITIDETGVIRTFNGPAERIFGYRADEVIGRNVSILMPEPYRSRHDRYLATYLRTGQARIIGIGREVEGLRKDGSIFPLDLAIGEMVVEEGRREFVGTVRDISERKRLEDQLRQAQKMETIGQLTGGVAHDFNNLLTVILGNAEDLADELKGEPRLRELAEMTRIAAERGAELTKRLLAFARRQALDPRATDLNALLGGIEGLLRRTLGEDIAIQLARAPGLWPAQIDATQLEAAVLNLCVNARDAMPGGGRLTIETANAPLDLAYAGSHPDLQPGDYVMIAITDTGTGMPAEVAARAFEPFFTTKEVGRGSGLGLSMVYGFAKQSGGHVKIYSEPGHGTVVKLYLPRASSPEPLPAPSQAVESRGAGTILAVEDDELVRRHVEGLLSGLGYRVIAAADGPSALSVLRGGEPIDLLFTDVVMPGGMDGGALAEAAQALRPGLPVLFTSGYTEHGIVHHGRLEPGIHLLAKPYRRQELAAKLRELLRPVETRHAREDER